MYFVVIMIGLLLLVCLGRAVMVVSVSRLSVFVLMMTVLLFWYWDVVCTVHVVGLIIMVVLLDSLVGTSSSWFGWVIMLVD